jgi:prophage DNA circulation protein
MTLINDTRKKDLFADIRAFASDAYNGGMAQPRTAFRIAEAAKENAVSMAVDPDTKRDDFHFAMEEYVKAFSRKSGEDWTEKSKTKLASQFRAFGRCGGLNTCNGVSTLKRTMAIHAEMAESDRKSLYPAMYSVAVQQCKSPEAELSDDVITSLVSKGTAKPSGQAAMLKRAMKLLEDSMVASDADSSLNDDISSVTSKIAGLVAYLADAEVRAEEMAMLAELQAKYQRAA